MKPFAHRRGRDAARLALALLAGAALLAHPGAARGQYSAHNVRLYSQITPQEMNGTGGNDCWSYVSPSGREYVIAGLYETTAFVEVTDPVNPVIVHIEPHSSSITGDMKVYGQYAYSIGDYYNLQVFDLGRIDEGVVAKVNERPFRTHNVALNEESGYAYMCASSHGSGIVALDLSDPVTPTIAGHINPTGGHVHDAQVVTYQDGPYAGREIAFCPSGYWRFDIIDVTDKGNMFLVGSLVYDGLNYCHQGWLSDDRQYFYLDDELDELNGYAPTTRTLVIDVSDITNPRHVSSFTSGRTSTDHNLFWKDGFIYEGNYSSGFQLFDARTDPLNPTHVGWFDTYPENDAPGYGHGVWTALPFFPSGMVVANDRDRGLFILDASEARGERMFLSATPLIGGQSTTLSVQGATPSGRVYFIYSLTGEAWTRVNALGVYLNLASPVLAGAATANGNGEASLVRTVPVNARGRTVWLQAAEAGNTSTVLEEVVQ